MGVCRALRDQLAGCSGIGRRLCLLGNCKRKIKEWRDIEAKSYNKAHFEIVELEERYIEPQESLNLYQSGSSHVICVKECSYGHGQCHIPIFSVRRPVIVACQYTKKF